MKEELGIIENVKIGCWDGPKNIGISFNVLMLSGGFFYTGSMDIAKEILRQYGVNDSHSLNGKACVAACNENGIWSFGRAFTEGNGR